MSSHLHPRKHFGNGVILLLRSWHCLLTTMFEEYLQHENHFIANNKSLAAYQFGLAVMEATPHWQNLKKETDIKGECCCWTTWFRRNLKIHLSVGINHCQGFYCWESKLCNHICFTKSSLLLADWIKTTANIFPDCDDFSELIPKPGSMCMSKLLNGMISTDTCIPMQLTWSPVIDHIYRICIEKGMSDQNLKILEGKWPHGNLHSLASFCRSTFFHSFIH